jgi:ATP-dependent helicase/nuclease subunit B
VAARRRRTEPAPRRLIAAPAAARRVDAAQAWIAALDPAAEALVLGATWEAADEVVRRVVVAGGARFGLARFTLDGLARRLAERRLAATGRAPVAGLSFTAVVARAVHLARKAGALGYYEPVAHTPGFAVAAGRTLEELRMNDVSPEQLARLGRGGPDLATLAAGVERALAEDGLADRATVYAEALAALAEDGAWPTGLPVALVDVAAGSRRETALVAHLAAHAPGTLATVPAGDERAIERLATALGVDAEVDRGAADRSLDRLQRHLFGEPPPTVRPLDDSVAIAAWPDEARECVEIARAIQRQAAAGVPFDRMAVVLHAPAEYASHLEEAFARAEIPFFSATGARRPLPAGRALLALLACASEGLSARRFAEYLSLAQVPDPGMSADEARLDAVRAAARAGVGDEDRPSSPTPLREDPESAAVVDGTLQAPWRWEQLLVDAAVIGSRERWERRLRGLAEELDRRLAALDDDDEPRRERIGRTMRDLAHLHEFAVPLIDGLARLPARATWTEWLAALEALALATLREPVAVLQVLDELVPMGPIGPIDLDELQLVLTPRLRDLTVPPPRRRYGAVFVVPPGGVGGLAFDVVFVPGLAENLVPGRVVEDPVLLDADRQALGGALVVEEDRIAAQRLALRVAVGAAQDRVVLSYPRVDVERARPRVPSVYALDVLAGAEGARPGLGDLAERARAAGPARLGWPAPDDPAEAIDESEYDLALLGPLLDADPETTSGTATYLLGANPHLARALRARARRWIRRWTPSDGLVEPSPEAAAALAGHRLDARAFSPTALQHYAACPYRFFLQAVHRLTPREEPVALDAMDPLTRGSIFHDVQFGVLTRLRDAGLLPVDGARLSAATAILDEVLGVEEQRARDDLFPAIRRVWDDAIQGIRADLREWLGRMATVQDGWTPYRFELAFGLADRDRPHSDPASVDAPVTVLGRLRLRGSIDLVERRDDGVVRATDHKSGKVAADAGVVVGGGTVLQPVLYALACEELLPERVAGGRLYYCTSQGGFTERDVPLDAVSRAHAEVVVDTIGAALATGFLPAAPAPGACRWCDYRIVCGPREEQRVQHKPGRALEPLRHLRTLP